MSGPDLQALALAPSEDFRGAVIPQDAERLTQARALDLERYSETIRVTERAQELLKRWGDAYREPFMGITSDGQVESGLFTLADEDFDVEPAVAAATTLLAGLSEQEREQISYAIEAPQWRDWYNPEWLVNHHGLRLDESSETTREHADALIRACLSEAGYLKTARTRSANLYLGELYDLRHIMNEWSYHFLVFGEPSTTEPWGWSIYGHHLTLCVFVLGRQLVISPTFLGVEPTVIDRGDDSEPFRLFVEEQAYGLELQRSLSPELRRQAVIYEQMKDPAMPPGRWYFADERHLGGAYQDNRVVPYEGVRGDALDGEQRELLLRIAETFVSYLPDAPRAARMRQIERELDRTWWSWIGGCGDADPFYYRIQSPVVMLEFDNHQGVWLTNAEPAKYHVHTIARTPNAGDYGRELLRQHAAGAAHTETQGVGR